MSTAMWCRCVSINKATMKRLKLYILLLLVAVSGGVAYASEPSDSASTAINPKEIMFEHLLDGYGWEVPFDHHHRIPLPVIVWASDGLHCFSSSHLEHGHSYTDNGVTFAIAGPESEYKGKVVEITPDGEKRPWDFSITKNVCALFITVLLVFGLMIWLARFHKNHPYKAPRKGLGFLEVAVTFVYDGVVKPILGPSARKFAPYLMTVFFFILFMNLLGLIVIFPGGANLTGNIAVTLVLSICTFIATNLFANKHYWKEIFWPDVPLFLKAYPVPIMPVIELFGVFTKPFALMIRLFANMMAGHAVILSFTCVIFLGWSMGAGFGMGLNVFSVLMMLFMNCLEVLVAFVQAYVFTMLSSVFIGLAHQEGHHGN